MIKDKLLDNAKKIDNFLISFKKTKKLIISYTNEIRCISGGKKLGRQ